MIYFADSFIMEKPNYSYSRIKIMDNIKINGLEISRNSATHSSTLAKFQNSTLAAMELHFRVHENQVEKLTEISGKEVTVYDPFVQRTYLASYNVTRHSYTHNDPVHVFTIEIKEIEQVPNINNLFVNNEEYRVLDYRIEASLTSNEIYHSVLLELTPSQFQTLNRLKEETKDTEALFKRGGVDTEPVPGEFNLSFWSEHITEDADIHPHYKVILYYTTGRSSEEINTSKKKNDVFTLLLRNLRNQTYDLQIRFEYLITELVQSGSVDKEKMSLLLNAQNDQLLSKERRDELWISITKVKDAKEVFEQLGY
jgi:hypothetical protein